MKVFTVLTALFPSITFAQSTSGPNGILTKTGACSEIISGKISWDCIIDTIFNVIELILEFSGTVFLLMIVVGGYQIGIGAATGSSDTAGKERIKYAIIGFLSCVCSYAIVLVIIHAIQ